MESTDKSKEIWHLVLVTGPFCVIMLFYKWRQRMRPACLSVATVFNVYDILLALFVYR